MVGRGDRGDESVAGALRLLFGQLSARRRWQLGPVLGLMLLGALAELATLGALLPFLAAIADPDGSPVLAYVQPVLGAVGLGGRQQALYALAGLFAAAALVAGVLRIVLLWATAKFTHGVAHELGSRIYSGVLAQPYAYHTRHNSSAVIADINKVQIVTAEFLVPLMNALVAAVIALFISLGLLIVDPLVALVSGVAFAAIYLVTSAIVRPRLGRNGRTIAEAQGARVQLMQEGLGGIRDILLDRSQPVFTEAYDRAESRIRVARARNAVLAGGPRFVVEAIGMVVIALLAVTVIGRPGGIGAAIPVLGVLALGAQRLLPLVQQIYQGWAQAMGNRQSVLDVVETLRIAAPPPLPAPDPLPFTGAIVLDRVGFAYEAGRGPALHDIRLEIRKGMRVGIAGRTGSGKSTLMDLVIGLVEPGTGEIRIDGVVLDATNRGAWQRNIAHVPQFIYLSDASIAENIAFGVRRREIDAERLRRAAGQAELAEVIAALPEGYDTRIGERGIQLSGGQRQRIGIARALYKNANVLVFDEATSALDTDTEAAVMAAIGRLDRDLTILMIAHRLSTLADCDMVVRLEEGRIVSG